MSSAQTLVERCQRIELLIVDVDGVLTDGGIYVTDDGQELKKFHVRDGAALAYWTRLGKKAAVISGRSSQVVYHRAVELGIDWVLQGRLDKDVAMGEVLQAAGLEEVRCCVMGDDLADLPALRRAGLAVAVADAVPEVLEVAHYVTRARGGHGAVREVIELLLKAQGRWLEVLHRYGG
jgi:3-deoxy-D-manno-octulosonate 8-phosphate phosphatase (KDO 8-P phosphatase)